MGNHKEKKLWREKVTAEIGLVHVQAFAQEMGTTISAAEVAEFLNQAGRAIYQMQSKERDHAVAQQAAHER